MKAYQETHGHTGFRGPKEQSIYSLCQAKNPETHISNAEKEQNTSLVISSIGILNFLVFFIVLLVAEIYNCRGGGDWRDFVTPLELSTFHSSLKQGNWTLAAQGARTQIFWATDFRLSLFSQIWREDSRAIRNSLC